MADIELVVEISEDTFFDLKKKQNRTEVDCAILNGTPLPKGHGRLIDADRLKEEMEKDVRRAMSFVDLTDFVLLAPTIIEADKEQEHGT